MTAGGDAAALVDAMHALLAGQAVTEWQAVLTAVQQLEQVGSGPVGYWGISMGAALGVPLVAAQPRVHAAVLGLLGSPELAQAAARITVPVQFLVQWDDEQVPRAESLALFDAFGSAEKTLHANPGRHADLPRFETDSSLRFFARHLA
jgi:dienelactone hydrolase